MFNVDVAGTLVHFYLRVLRSLRSAKRPEVYCDAYFHPPRNGREQRESLAFRCREVGRVGFYAHPVEVQPVGVPAGSYGGVVAVLQVGVSGAGLVESLKGIIVQTEPLSHLSRFLCAA